MTETEVRSVRRYQNYDNLDRLAWSNVTLKESAGTSSHNPDSFRVKTVGIKQSCALQRKKHFKYHLSRYILKRLIK